MRKSYGLVWFTCEYISDFQVGTFNLKKIMNIATKLTSIEVVREINLMHHFDWTIEQKEEMILVLEKALSITITILNDISEDDFNSRLYFSGQQGTIEHYLLICKNLGVEDVENKLIDDKLKSFLYEKTEKLVPYSFGNVEPEPLPDPAKIPPSLFMAYTAITLWVLYLLVAILL